MNRTGIRVPLAALMIVGAGLPAMVAAGQSRPEPAERAWWVGLGAGIASVESRTPAPSAGRNALAVNLDGGFRLTPHLGIGLELGVLDAAGGCRLLVECGSAREEFAPDFAHVFAVGEFRLRGNSWRLRAGAGVINYCHATHNASRSGVDSALDALLGGSGDQFFRQCDSVNAFGGTVSVGYHHRLATRTPMSIGLRLGAEMADFPARGASGLPAFRHRAVMLTAQLGFD